MTDTELVKAELAARAIGLDRYFLYRLAARGLVHCYRAGRAVRFSIPELLMWMKEQGKAKADGNGTK